MHLTDATVLPDKASLCRLCMKKDVQVRNIFEDLLVEQVPIVVAIVACIHPLEVSLHSTKQKN